KSISESTHTGIGFSILPPPKYLNLIFLLLLEHLSSVCCYKKEQAEAVGEGQVFLHFVFEGIVVQASFGGRWYSKYVVRDVLCILLILFFTGFDITSIHI